MTASLWRTAITLARVPILNTSVMAFRCLRGLAEGTPLARWPLRSIATMRRRYHETDFAPARLSGIRGGDAGQALTKIASMIIPDRKESFRNMESHPAKRFDPQGQGYALSEELIYKDGRLMTPSLSEYLIPTAMDLPPVRSIILESRSGLGPNGAKGISEAGADAGGPRDRQCRGRRHRRAHRGSSHHAGKGDRRSAQARVKRKTAARP
jgi:hypothetical protein